MNDTAPLPVTATAVPPAIHERITPERAAIFLEALRNTGSYKHAAAIASPHLVARGSKQCSVGRFREYARRHPEFAAGCEAAMNEAVGRAENLLWERAYTPDERPIFDKNGRQIGVQKDSRSANQMLLAYLARHDPTAWAPKQHIKNDLTVTHSDADLASGANYVVRPNDMMLLSATDREQLISLLVKIEQAREPAALPDADVAEAPALPAPQEAADGAE